MGEVFRALDEKLNRHVAIKILHSCFCTSPEVMRRFSNEGRVLAKLRHKNIVKVFDYGTVNETPYLCQEFIEGTDLKKLIEADYPFTPNEVVHIVAEVASALVHLHENNILHRDLKPANVIITKSGAVKVMDFGLVLEDSATRLTETGGYIGSLGYLPPEIFKGAEYSTSVDIYQVGCLIYELLHKKALVSTSDLTQKSMVGLLSVLAQINQSTEANTTDLSEIMKACLAVDSSARPSSIELYEALTDAQSDDIDLSKLTPTQAITKVSPLVEAETEGMSPILILVIVLFLLLPMSLFWPKPKHSLTSFDVETGPTSIRAKFSFTPMAEGKWLLMKNGTILKSGNIEKVQSQSLRTSGLKPNSSYLLELQLDDGQRISKNIDTPALTIIPPLRVKRRRRQTDGKLFIRCQLSHSSPLSLKTGEKDEQRSEQAAKSHNFTVHLTTKDMSKRFLPYELSSPFDTIKRGEFSMGPQVVFQGLRNPPKVPPNVREHSAERVKRTSTVSLPFRMTVGPLVVEDNLFCGDRNGFLYAINITNWKLLWIGRLPGVKNGFAPDPLLLQWDGPNHLHSLADNNGKTTVYRINHTRRSLKWSKQKKPLAYANSDKAEELEPSAGESSKAVDLPPIEPLMQSAYTNVPRGRAVSFVRQEKLMLCIDLETAKVIWKTHIDVANMKDISRPVIDDKNVFVLCQHAPNDKALAQEELFAYQIDTGKLSWRKKLNHCDYKLKASAPLVVDDILFAGSGDELLCLTADNGDIRRRRKLPFIAIGTPAHVDDNVALFCTRTSEQLSIKFYQIGFAQLSFKESSGAIKIEWMDTFRLRQNIYADFLEVFVCDNLFCFSFDNVLHGFTANSFTREWEDSLSGKMLSKPVRLRDGWVFCTLDGKVQLQPKDQ